MDFLLYLQIFAYAAMGAAGMLAFIYFFDKILKNRPSDYRIARLNRKLDRLIERNKRFLESDKIGKILQSAAWRNVCPLPAFEKLDELKGRCENLESHNFDLEIEKMRYENARSEVVRMRAEITELTKENDGLRKALDDLQTRDKASEPRRNPPRKTTKGAKK